MQRINCRFCGGVRSVSQGGICTGCGSDATAAQTQRLKFRRKCPKCSDGQMEMMRVDYMYRCQTCGNEER